MCERPTDYADILHDMLDALVLAGHLQPSDVLGMTVPLESFKRLHLTVAGHMRVDQREMPLPGCVIRCTIEQGNVQLNVHPPYPHNLPGDDELSRLLRVELLVKRLFEHAQLSGRTGISTSAPIYLELAGLIRPTMLVSPNKK